MSALCATNQILKVKIIWHNVTWSRKLIYFVIANNNITLHVLSKGLINNNDKNTCIYS